MLMRVHGVPAIICIILQYGMIILTFTVVVSIMFGNTFVLIYIQFEWIIYWPNWSKIILLTELFIYRTLLGFLIKLRFLLLF